MCDPKESVSWYNVDIKVTAPGVTVWEPKLSESEYNVAVKVTDPVVIV